jgi:tight adherence protein C
VDVGIAIAFLLVVTVGCWTMAIMSFNSREVARARLKRIASGATSGVVRDPDAPIDGSGFRQQIARWVEGLSGPREGSEESGAYGNMRRRLIEAGFRRQGALQTYMGGRIALGIGLGLLALGPAFLVPQVAAKIAIIALAAGAGFIAPGMFIDARRRARQRTIVRPLPDAIDLMVVCVEAGLSLASALNRVASEFYRASPVLAGEFRLTVLETQAGKSLAQALRTLGVRNGVQDLSTLASALIQTERLGTRVADTLRVQADGLRVRRLQRAEEVAQRAPVKMLFPMVFLIFPAMIVLLILPGIMQVMRTFEP